MKNSAILKADHARKMLNNETDFRKKNRTYKRYLTNPFKMNRKTSFIKSIWIARRLLMIQFFFQISLQ